MKNIGKLIIVSSIVFILSLLSGYFKLFSPKYNVIIYNENEIVIDKKIKSDNLIIEPTPPTKEDYTFIGWYCDDEKFDFSKPINKNTKIVARWEANPKEIILSEDIVELYTDDHLKIDATVYPEEAANKTIVWKVKDESIATINEDGVITALSEGKTIVTAKTFNNKTSKLNLIVKNTEVNEIKINTENIIIEPNESKPIDIEILPKNAVDTTVKWYADDNNIVSISNNGVVKGLKPGKTKVHVKSINGITNKIDIEVKDVKPESISIISNKSVISINEKLNLNIKYEPSNTTKKDVKWESSNSSIAKINDNGTITAFKKGTVKITATTSNGKKSSINLKIISKTENKTAIFFGDSITYGTYGTPKGYSWANYIGDNYDFKSTTNAGKSGWLISNYLGEKWIVNKVKEYKNTNYDYVILHGGTNDIGKKTPLGIYSKNDFSGNYDTKTFLGGLETYIYTVKKQWPNAKIGYIINYETPNSSKARATLSKGYYDQMKKVLDKWNIKYIDLYSGSTPSGTKYSDLLKVKTYKYILDGLHLNSKGYNLISPYIYNFITEL